MIIDFHTHIFPPDMQRQREKFFHSEPAFKLLYDSPKSRIIGAEEMVEMMDAQGVDKAVVFGFPWQTDVFFKKNNDYVVEATRQYPERLIGFGCFDPFNSDAKSEAERCVNAGLCGIGEIAFYQTGIDKRVIDRLKPIMEICSDKDVPILIHTNEPLGHVYPGKTPNTMLEIYSLVKKFKQNKIILAHWGGGLFFYHLLIKEVKEILKNVYVDTAASPFLYHTDIYSITIQTAGPDRILFGSDFPLIKPERYFNQMNTAGLSETDRKKICGKNAALLLKLDTV